MTKRGWMGDTSAGDYGPDDGDDYCGATEDEVMESLQEEVQDQVQQNAALRRVLRDLVNTCEHDTGSPWPALEAARAALGKT